MITSISRKPQITIHLRKYSALEDVACWLSVVVPAGNKPFSSEVLQVDPCAWGKETIQQLEELSARIATLRRSMEENELKGAQSSSGRRTWTSVTCYELYTSANNALAEAWRKLMLLQTEMARNEAILQLLCRAIRLKSGTADERSYALYRGAVWCSDRDLEAEQWQVFADRFVDREDAELASALSGSESAPGRERIAPEVRRAVWIRDQGKCRRCGSRERLEYDHIVPVSRGGSNTERNIELLCEICNRAKSNSIS
jgi:hypothetical protein